MISTKLAAFSVLVSFAVSTNADPPSPRSRGRAFWTPVVEECTVPPGESAFSLVSEAVSLLGSPDTNWRDDVGYGVVASCVYRKRALSPDERRKLVELLTANLNRGVGEQGTDSVLLRSFSALDLSIFAALEIEAPALDEAGYRHLLEAAFSYLADERDLRGLEPRLGWIHATAHTADLLEFLARDPRFTPADQKRLLDVVQAKLTASGTPVFTHAEDERLAAAVASVVARTDFDPALLDPWLDRFVRLEKQVWSKAPPAAGTLASAQNGRNLLRSLFVLLSLPERTAAGASHGPRRTQAREKLLAVLETIRR